MKQQKPQPLSKKQAYRRAERRRQQVRTAAIIIAFVALAAFAVSLGLSKSDPATTSVSEQIEGITSYSNLERDHVETPVVYEQNPPVGGAHSSTWQNCGVYTTPIANENAVHSMEHGAVWITYQPDLPAGDMQNLQTLTRQSGFRLLSPYADIPSPIVISAWGYQLELEQADDPRLKSFIEQYELSPLGPEPGAPCTGGLGEPG